MDENVSNFLKILSVRYWDTESTLENSLGKPRVEIMVRKKTKNKLYATFWEYLLDAMVKTAKVYDSSYE